MLKSNSAAFTTTKFQFTSDSAQTIHDNHFNICCMLLCFYKFGTMFTRAPFNNKNEHSRVHQRHVGSPQQFAKAEHRFWLHKYHYNSYQKCNQLPGTAGRTQLRQKLLEVRITSHRSKYQSITDFVVGRRFSHLYLAVLLAVRIGERSSLPFKT